MNSILQANETIYFETKCVIAMRVGASVPPALLKLLRFSKESSLKPYIIQMMDEEKTCLLLLTKQNLSAKTAYYCSSAHLNSRWFGSVETLMGNNVKRLLSKSDSKFFSRFSNLLKPNNFYTKQIDNNFAVKFSKSGSNGVKMARVATDSRWKFESASQCYQIEAETPGLVTLAACKISPPNLMMNLWDAPEVARKYILEDIANGVTEDRDCKEGYLVSAASKQTIHLAGIGHIELEAEERSSCARTAEVDTDDSCKCEDSLVEDCSLDLNHTTIKQTLEIITSSGPKLPTPQPDWLDRFTRLKETRLRDPGCYRLF